MTVLKGMTWSHDRGVKPLLAASKIFAEKNPGVTIEWDARSLADFELFPLEELAGKYDFIMIDHPHIGAAYAQNLLLPLDQLLDESFLQEQKKKSVGQSYMSYNWEETQWALPADSAAQVCAYRKDLLGEKSLPETWKDFFSLAQSLPAGVKPGIPFVPVHAYSSFFTLSSQLNHSLFWSEGSDLDPDVGVKALELLSEILAVAHPSSFDSDPIDMLDAMGKGDEIAYIPLIYGYSNYAREGYLDHVVRFGNIPSDTGKPEGSMIGGVGLAVSSRCNEKELAASFVRMVLDPEFQKREFFENAGQPGHRDSWTDKGVNEKSNGFFSETLETLDEGSMRPRFDGYIEFQGFAGGLIRAHIQQSKTNHRDLVLTLNRMIREYRNKSGDTK